jgi:spore germination protein GerM
MLVAYGAPGSGMEPISDDTEELESIDEEEVLEELEEWLEEKDQEEDIYDEKNTAKYGIKTLVYQWDDEEFLLIPVEVSIESLTADNLLEAIIHLGILPDDVKVLDFSESVSEGQKLLELNLSKEYEVLLGNQGTTGEIIILGSIVNTFLSAFDGERILLTVEGETFFSPHVGEVSQPLGRF